MLTTAEPAVIVSLEETGDGWKPLALQFQVFAYADDDLLAASEAWAVEVETRSRAGRPA